MQASYTDRVRSDLAAAVRVAGAVELLIDRRTAQIEALEAGKPDRASDMGQLAQYAELDLCNALIGLADDGDFLAHREQLCCELGCDEDGNLTDDNGDIVGDDGLTAYQRGDYDRRAYQASVL